MSKTPLPIKGLGTLGVITDVEPYELPLNAWSMGNNVHFEDAAVHRADTFRVVEGTMTPTRPVLCHGVRPAAGGDYIIYAGDDGQMYKWASGTETNITNASFTPAVLPAPYTAARSGEVQYINRDGHQPYYYSPVTATSMPLTGWDSGWSCKALREFNDHLIAINITKAGTQYPNTIKTSDTITADVPPGSWDHTDLSTNCIERPIAGMSSLVDGLTLGNSFMLYGDFDVFRMEFVRGKYIYSTRKAFTGPGCISQNCVVDQGGYHYVFGNTDIYRHDGSRWESIADGRVRRYIFDNLSLGDAYKFFAIHQPEHKEIYFCYVASDDQVTWAETEFCNKAAVYNYNHNTWTFQDLPNVTASSFANVNVALTYANANQTYEEIGGTYFDQESAADTTVCIMSVASTTHGLTVSKMLGFDLADQGTLSYPIDTESEVDAYVERVGMDLDELGLPSRTMKVVSGILPKVKTWLGNTITVEVGAHNLSEEDPTWQTAQTFDPASDYKSDVMAAGRYLAIRFTSPATSDFKFAQYDLMITQAGHR
jgi:hypothetical protein